MTRPPQSVGATRPMHRKTGAHDVVLSVGAIERAISSEVVAGPPTAVEAEGRVGSVLRGKWRLDRLLGIGGTATVYAATHRNGRRGALKLLSPSFYADRAMRERFLREGWVANRVDHPGVVRVLDDDVTEDDGVFLVMELLQGHTLAEHADARGGRLPIDEVLVHAAAVLDVLGAAHAHGIVHRDIKPENIFLTEDERIKVLDFGLACMFEGDTATRVTKSGFAMGTPTFMAPEQARGRRDLIDPRTDIYSLGATMFSLLTEEFVHGSNYRTVAELVAVTITRQARSLAEAMPDAPKLLVALVDRALRLDKADRFGSAAAMRTEVARVYEKLFARPLPVSLPPRSWITSDPSFSAPISAPNVARRTTDFAATWRVPTFRARPIWPTVAAGFLLLLLVLLVVTRPSSRAAARATPPHARDVREALVHAPLPPVAPVSEVTEPRTEPAAEEPNVLVNVTRARTGTELPRSPSRVAGATPRPDATVQGDAAIADIRSSLYDRRY